MKILENLCQPSEIFGKSSGCSVFSGVFIIIFLIFGKSSEVFGNHRKIGKTLLEMFVMVRRS